MPHNDKVVECLQQLVALPSVNPEHTRDPEIANEFRVAEFLAEYLSEKGFQIEWDRATPERPNLIASYGPAAPVRTLLLEAHTDTVGVEGMVISPFDPRIENGRLHGRGSCDTKGPMAAALCALTPERLERLAQAGVRILFVGAFGEEKGNLGAERLVEQGVGADAAIILEPTDLNVVHAHKGALWVELTLSGELAHSSEPTKGLNAINAMADLLGWLQTRIAADCERHGDAALGSPTLNVGRIEGGMAINIVPHHCRVEIDRRIVPGESPDDFLQPLEQQLEQMKLEGRIRAYTLKIIKAGMPFITDPAAPLVCQLRQAIESSGRPAEVTTAAWYSDAGAFGMTCKEVVVFGPGSIAQAHTKDEYIDIEELIAGQQVLEQFLDAFAEPTS